MKKLKTYKQLFENKKLKNSFDNFNIDDIEQLEDFVDKFGINVVDRDDNTLLIYLIRKQRKTKINMINYLIDNGVNINARNIVGDNALNWSAYFNLTVIINLLILNNIDINNQDNNGMSPLMTASADGNHESVKILLDNDVDINITCNHDRTALHYCSKNLNFSTSKYLITLDLLLRTDINWNIIDKDNKTFIDYLSDDIVEDIITKYSKKYKKYIREKQAKKFKI